MKLPSISRKNTAIFNTLLAVGLGFLLYFLLHSKNKEKDFVEKCYRDLNRISENIDNKLKSYHSNAQYIFNFTKEEDSIRISEKSIKETVDNRKVNKNLKVESFQEIEAGTTGIEHSLTIISNEKIYFDIQREKIKVTFSTDAENFFNPLIRNTVLEEFVLFDATEKTSFYSTFLPNVTIPYTKVLSKADTVNDKKESLLKIGGKKYYHFKAMISYEDPESQMYVLGLISEDIYNQNIRSFDSWFMVLLIILLIIILLSLPLIKLFNLGSIEELHIHDCVFVAVSVLMGTSVAVFLIITTFNNRFEQRHSIDENLKNLSSTIINKFENELDDIYHQLNFFETADIQLETTLTCKDSGDVRYYKLNLLDTFCGIQYPYFKYVYWLDSVGIQSVLLSVFSNPVRHDTLAHRDYFQKIKNGNGWLLPSYDKLEQKNEEPEFFIESIRSISTGECIAAISKRSNPNPTKPPFDSLNTKVIAMTTQLYSLMDPVMERGYSFCVVDQNGEVLFHSNKDFNLQENLLEENTTDNHLVESAVQSRTGNEMMLRYHDKKQRAYIHPIVNLPFHLVTMYEYEIWESSKTQILSISFILFLVSLVIFLFQAGILYVINKRFSKINTPIISLRWLKYSSESPAEMNYFKIICANAMLIVFLVIANIWLFNHNSNLLLHLLLCWTTPVISFAFTYKILASARMRKRANWFVCLSVLIVLVLSIFLYRNAITVNTGAIIMGYYVASGLSVFIIFNTAFINPIGKLINIARNKQKAYVLLFLTWLLLFAFIPSFIYYKISYDLEEEISARYNLFEFTNIIASRQQLVDDYYKEIEADYIDRIKKQKTTFGIYTEPSFEMTGCFDQDIRNDTSLVNLLQPYLKLTSSVKNTFIHHSAQDGSWKSYKNNSKLAFKNIHLNYSEYYVQQLEKLNLINLNLEASSEKTQGEAIGIWSFYMICLVVFVIALYHLLQIIARKISGYNIITHYTESEPLKQIDFDRYTQSKDLKLMVIGPSGAEKRNMVMKKVKKHKHVFINLHRPEEYAHKNELNDLIANKDFIVLGYFGYSYFDDEINDQKLQLLNRLFKTRINVIILSDISPDQVYDVYDEKMQHLADGNVDRRHYYISKQIEWKQLLDSFIQIYQPLMEDHIDKMLEASPMPHGLPMEEKIRMEQNYLHNYYHTIWKNLSLEEKFLLYDYAVDELININNRRALNALAAKGLLHDKHGSLQIIKRSFRNFILSALKPEEESIRMREISKKGRWNVLRIILLLVVTALFVVIYLSNKEILFDFKAILIAVGSMLSLLIKFSGTFKHSPANQF